MNSPPHHRTTARWLRWRRLLLATFAVLWILQLQVPVVVAQESDEETLGAAVEAAELSGDPAQRAQAHNALGAFYFRQSLYSRAIDEFRRARDLWTALDDDTGLGRVHNNIGAVQYQWGNFGLALESYRRSLEVRRALGDRRTVALVLINISEVHRHWGQYDRAQLALDEAMVLSGEAGAHSERAYAWHHLGMLRFDQGRMEEAREAFDESQRIYTDPLHALPTGVVRSGIGLNQVGMARLLMAQGETAEAARLIEDLFGGDPMTARTGRQAGPLSVLGLAYLEMGQSARARATLEHALALGEGASQRSIVLDVLAALARVHEARGEPAEALRYERRRAELREAQAAEVGDQELAAIEFRDEAQRRARENVGLREGRRLQDAELSRQRIITGFSAALLVAAVLLVATLVHANRIGRARAHELAVANTTLEERNVELQAALAEVRTLSGLIPICAHCKKIRDEKGFWESVENYVESRSEALFSHGICSECGPKLYGDDWVGDDG